MHRVSHQKQPTAPAGLLCKSMNKHRGKHMIEIPPSPLEPSGTSTGCQWVWGRALQMANPKPWPMHLCHHLALMPGLGQAPFWLFFFSFSHVYSSYSTIFTKRELHKWCWRGGLGHSLLLGLHFPPRHPALICFQHSSHSVCSSPCCWEPSCAVLHSLWDAGACNHAAADHHMVWTDVSI